ncbi:MAG: DUF4062 domain-containing protein, partial [Thiomargarita sp.]|nr:DUF4062 domain-containing protein [Thiomargarita sp.]
MKKFEDRHVRLFISSTFKGMHEERKVLVKHIFPEIRKRCAQRGIGFTEVDLRWGITREEVDQGLTTLLCFQQIDHCQPFFIGLLGEYYGTEISPEQTETVRADHPWIAQNYSDRSFTELEMTYGLFKVGQERSDEQRQALTDNALFYFRDPNYANTLPEKNRAKQQD